MALDIESGLYAVDTQSDDAMLAGKVVRGTEREAATTGA